MEATSRRCDPRASGIGLGLNCDATTIVIIFPLANYKFGLLGGMGANNHCCTMIVVG